MIALVVGLILLCIGLVVSRLCWWPPWPKPPPIEEVYEEEAEGEYEYYEGEESELEEESKDEMVPVEPVSSIYDNPWPAWEILEVDNSWDFSSSG